jgi:hypothetical protein
MTYRIVKGVSRLGMLTAECQWMALARNNEAARGGMAATANGTANNKVKHHTTTRYVGSVYELHGIWVGVEDMVEIFLSS